MDEVRRAAEHFIVVAGVHGSVYLLLLDVWLGGGQVGSGGKRSVLLKLRRNTYVHSRRLVLGT